MVAPGRAVALVVDLEHGEVGHEAIGGRRRAVVLAGLEEDAVPRPDHLDRPAAALAQAHALGDVNLRDGKVAWRAFLRTEQEALEAVGLRRRRRAGVASRWDPGACVISQCLRAPEGRLLRSALR
jgi:hypothetical protein